MAGAAGRARGRWWRGGVVALVLASAAACAPPAPTGEVVPTAATPRGVIASAAATPSVARFPPSASPATARPGTGVAASPSACGPRFTAGHPFTFASRADHAWGSGQVVVGTVEAQEVRWDRSYIVTISRVRVEERARGLPFATLLVRTPGGTLDGCTQRVFPEIPLVPGERVLLFLAERNAPPSPALPQTPTTLYDVIGGPAGKQTLADDADIAALLLPLRQALAQPPPPDLDPRFLIPLDRAPVAPVPVR